MKSSGLVEEVYLVRFEKIILGGGGVQYQQTSNQSNTAGWFDFVSVTMETSATSLLDIQAAPNVTKVFLGVQNILISDYAGSDWLKPHFGSPTAQVISVNISTPLASVDAITIASAGYPNFIPAVRVYAGRLTGTTILAGDGKLWSTNGVVDHLGLPIGTWKMADQAGWLMSGPSIMGNGQHTAALTFTVSGETKPRKIVHVDGSVAYLRPEAAEDEPPTVLERHLSAKVDWNPPLLVPGAATTVVVRLGGCRQGDIVMVAHAGLVPRLQRVQLTAVSGDEEAEVTLVNVGTEPVDVPAGRLRLVVVQMQ